MNKRGFAEGLSWFFAIIITALILILFYLLVSFSSKEPMQKRGDFYLGDFYKEDSLKQIIFMEDYDHQGIYNNLSYQIFEGDYSFGTNSKFVLFLDSISKDIFSRTSLGIYPAFMSFSFGMNSIAWSFNNMDGPSYNDGPSDTSNLVSKLKKERGINVAYVNIWDMSPVGDSILTYEGRLYRLYFLNKGQGFVRFGTSAVQRQ